MSESVSELHGVDGLSDVNDSEFPGRALDLHIVKINVQKNYLIHLQDSYEWFGQFPNQDNQLFQSQTETEIERVKSNFKTHLFDFSLLPDAPSNPNLEMELKKIAKANNEALKSNKANNKDFDFFVSFEKVDVEKYSDSLLNQLRIDFSKEDCSFFWWECQKINKKTKKIEYSSSYVHSLDKALMIQIKGLWICFVEVAVLKESQDVGEKEWMLLFIEKDTNLVGIEWCINS